jgi:hypothetical protein
LGFGYYAAAFLCLVAFKSKKKSPDVHRGLRAYVDPIRSFVMALVKRRFDLPPLARAAAPWFFLALFMIGLGVVRQFNLQTMVTRTMQALANTQGWYAERARPQLLVVLGVAIAATIAVLLLLVVLRKRLADVGLALFAAGLLAALLSVRAVSHHTVDAILMAPVAGVPPAYAIELLALLLLSGHALIRSRASS